MSLPVLIRSNHAKYLFFSYLSSGDFVLAGEVITVIPDIWDMSTRANRTVFK